MFRTIAHLVHCPRYRLSNPGDSWQGDGQKSQGQRYQFQAMSGARSDTLTQLRDRFVSPNWHPGDYPPRPEIVAQGRKPDVFACVFCHRADGPGGPENANLTGLGAAYIVQQMADFKSGARKSSVPNRAPATLKASLAKAITDAEVEAAAAYFSSTPERIEQISNLVERGKRRDEIAEIIGVTTGMLQVTCSKLGISLRRPTFDLGTGLLPRQQPGRHQNGSPNQSSSQQDAGGPARKGTPTRLGATAKRRSAGWGRPRTKRCSRSEWNTRGRNDQLIYLERYPPRRS
jgi:cytochrome c553